jgi:hypothetical protein
MVVIVFSLLFYNFLSELKFINAQYRINRAIPNAVRINYDAHHTDTKKNNNTTKKELVFSIMI